MSVIDLNEIHGVLRTQVMSGIADRCATITLVKDRIITKCIEVEKPNKQVKRLMSIELKRDRVTTGL